MTCAMVKVLPEPVTPSRTWSLAPPCTPSISSAIAFSRSTVSSSYSPGIVGLVQAGKRQDRASPPAPQLQPRAAAALEREANRGIEVEARSADRAERGEGGEEPVCDDLKLAGDH